VANMPRSKAARKRNLRSSNGLSKMFARNKITPDPPPDFNSSNNLAPNAPRANHGVSNNRQNPRHSVHRSTTLCNHKHRRAQASARHARHSMAANKQAKPHAPTSEANAQAQLAIAWAAKTEWPKASAKADNRALSASNANHAANKRLNKHLSLKNIHQESISSGSLASLAIEPKFFQGQARTTKFSSPPDARQATAKMTGVPQLEHRRKSLITKPAADP